MVLINVMYGDEIFIFNAMNIERCKVGGLTPMKKNILVYAIYITSWHKNIFRLHWNICQIYFV